MLPFGTLYCNTEMLSRFVSRAFRLVDPESITIADHGEFGPTAAEAAASQVARGEEPTRSRSEASCMASLKALNESDVKKKNLWVNQEVAGLMDDFDVNVQFDAALEAGADGLILWGGGSQP